MRYIPLTKKLFHLGPVIFLYFLSISEIDTFFESKLEILSFNIQIIIVYFWGLKRSELLGGGHVFFAGLLNDVVMGNTLGLSSITYLIVYFVATYVKNVTVNTRITTDWFTFFFGVFFSNLAFYILASNFSELTVNLTEISYNTFFTMLFFPFFWFIFNLYNAMIISGKNV